MKHPLLSLALLAASAAASAQYECLDPRDPTGYRRFQSDPCPPGEVHSPIRVHPALLLADRYTPEPDRLVSAGSSWQVLGYDERGRVVGRWVERGTAVPWVSTDSVRITGPRGGRGRGGRR